MGRARKTKLALEIDEKVGAQVRRLREERNLSLGDVADRIDVSIAQLSALESGRYSFSTTRLVQLAKVLGVPPAALLPDDSDELGHRPLRETLDSLIKQLEEPELFMVLDFARQLAGAQHLAHLWRHMSAPGRLVSLEGVDGVLLQDQAHRLQARYLRETRKACLVCEYDFDTPLWGHMIERFASQRPKVRDQSRLPFERTLLFSCERLYRQAAHIMPAWRAGQLVVVPFFALAASIYQELERRHDLILVKVVQKLLVPANPVIVLDSDPALAFSRAVAHRPGEGQFYSPYQTEDEFRRARELHREAPQRYDDPQAVHLIETEDRPADDVAEEVWNIVFPPEADAANA